MRQLYTISFPELRAADAEFIEAFRREHDALGCEIVAAHFTLVFASCSVPEKDYLRHVERVAAASEPIRFVCQRAILGADEHTGDAHVFLVPDSGFAEMAGLHDRLYAGRLASELRSDLSFVPHMTMGTMADPRTAEDACEALNQELPRVEGWLRELIVATVDGGRLEKLGAYRLGGVQPLDVVD